MSSVPFDPEVIMEHMKFLIHSGFVRAHPRRLGEGILVATVHNAKDNMRSWGLTEYNHRGKLMGQSVVAYEVAGDDQLVVWPRYEGLPIEDLQAIAIDIND